jgi:aspartate aminotransferase
VFLDKIEGSPSLEMVNLILQKQTAGEKVVSLAIGEPSFNTPREIIDVAYASMKAGDVHYTSSYGIAEVREAITKKVRRRNSIKAAIGNTIFLTTKFSVYASLMAVVKRKCEILVPDPGYFYSEPVILSGAIPRHYPLGQDFSLDANLIRKKISKNTRAIIVNTPSNPTARVFAKSELRELYELCRDRDVLIISDEAYEDLVYEGNHFSIGSLEKEPETVVSLFSLSKSYAMTGWRAGYVVAGRNVIARIGKFLENTYTSYPPFIQKASAYALLHGDRFVARFVAQLNDRRKLAEELLQGIKGVESYKAQGAFYLFPRYEPEDPSVAVSKKILQEQGVAVLPGVAFGSHGENRIRLSFSGGERTLRDGMDRLAKFFMCG